MKNIYYKKCAFGLGIFAGEEIASGEIIEICPIKRVSHKESNLGNKKWFDDYLYEFGDEYAFVLGLGSLYNHSYAPNAIFVRDEKRDTMTYISLCHINKDEQIFVNYNGNIYCRDLLWFNDPKQNN